MTVHARLTRDAIDPGSLAAMLRSASCGAVASFAGTVRDHNDGRPVLALEYEAYELLAERELRRIAEMLLTRYRLGGIAIEHRVGALDVGDIAVAVVVTAEHRAAALAACADAIEFVKRDVPIWKREHHPEGARWVGGCAEEHHEQHGETGALTR